MPGAEPPAQLYGPRGEAVLSLESQADAGRASARPRIAAAVLTTGFIAAAALTYQRVWYSLEAPTTFLYEPLGGFATIVLGVITIIPSAAGFIKKYEAWRWLPERLFVTRNGRLRVTAAVAALVLSIALFAFALCLRAPVAPTRLLSSDSPSTQTGVIHHILTSGYGNLVPEVKAPPHWERFHLENPHSAYEYPPSEYMLSVFAGYAGSQREFCISIDHYDLPASFNLIWVDTDSIAVEPKSEPDRGGRNAIAYCYPLDTGPRRSVHRFKFALRLYSRNKQNAPPITLNAYVRRDKVEVFRKAFALEELNH